MKNGIYKFIIESPLNKIIKTSGLKLPELFEHGWGNGYVLLPQKHPLYGVHYDDFFPSVHGGLTFGDIFNSENFLNWIENKEIGGDLTIENYKELDGYWMFGFDTSHYKDNMYNCSKEYVLSETNKLVDNCLDNNIPGVKKYNSVYFRKSKLKKIDEIKGLNDD